MKNKNDYDNFDSFAEKHEQFVSTFLGTPWFGWENLSGEKAIDSGCGAGQATKIKKEILWK